MRRQAQSTLLRYAAQQGGVQSQYGAEQRAGLTPHNVEHMSRPLPTPGLFQQQHAAQQLQASEWHLATHQQPIVAPFMSTPLQALDMFQPHHSAQQSLGDDAAGGQNSATPLVHDNATQR
jgi:hypothetical protein